jgi:alkanesulfonate monooxygenase SsuD/methylene tetrahydromethanopterin reductase-like flavin-dependent oxidoreductase (luciferase family)
MTGGRFGWNIVTSWKKAAFKAIGVDTPIEHDERYAQADEYLRVLYKYGSLVLLFIATTDPLQALGRILVRESHYPKCFLGRIYRSVQNPHYKAYWKVLFA